MAPLQPARLALIVAALSPVRRATGMTRAPTPPWPGGPKCGRRRPGAQRPPKARPPDRRQLRRVRVSVIFARRLPKSGGQPGPARSARP
jgi:hypothetical protein